MVSMVALIVGNMIGTGIFTLPASLASDAGPVSLISWGVTAVGFLLLSIVYADMGHAYPRSGGPSVYARHAFGDFIGFEIAFSYWLSIIIGNAAIVIATVGYIAEFSPLVKDSLLWQVMISLSLVWILALVNILGVREGASVAIVTTTAKLVPLVLLVAVGIWQFNPDHLTPFAPMGTSAIIPGMALVAWAFSGLESATVPAEEATDARTIRRSTLIGFGIATALYILISVTVMGLLPNDVIAGSSGPLALAASQVMGPWGATLIAAGAIVSGLGTLNGWILLSGRVPLSVAEDGLFPKGLARIHPRFHTPHVSLIIAAIVASGMILLRLSRSLIETFEFIILLSVLLVLVPHVTTTIGEYLLARQNPGAFSARSIRATSIIAMASLVFVVWVIYGTGWEAIGWGGLFLVAGVPVYWVMRREGRG
ncbi:MAG: amino acid permease [candidate division Zixibacteria bacterium]|nr:amino acid permease [candidate division Zixibacteria bacterium]